MTARNSGSGFARRVLGAMLAVFGLCVLTPAPARAQEVEWTRLFPSAQDGHAMAYDTARGVSASPVEQNGHWLRWGAETWEWSGTV